MKCPECGYNQLRGKNGMECYSCEYKFIFDPKKHLCDSKPLTDGFFIKSIDLLSRNNTYYFSEDELYCFMAHRTKRSFILRLITSLFIIAFVFEFTHEISPWFPFVLAPLFIYLSIKYSRKVIKRKQWNKLLKHWNKQAPQRVNQQHTLSGLLSTPQLTEAPTAQSEPDIYDYGASKLLICQHDIQVDWLVMNKFHSQNGIVVIAESGYPHYLTERVTHLIENNPDLEIYLLHNTGQQGENMINRLQSPQSIWNLSQHRCVDLGMTEEQLLKTGLKRHLIQQFKGDFPAHGLHYHGFSQLLTHSITTGVTIAAAIEVFSHDSDSGVSCDFG